MFQDSEENCGEKKNKKKTHTQTIDGCHQIL